MKTDIVRDDADIRDLLLERITSLRLTFKMVEDDARELGKTTIHQSRLSRYFNPDKNDYSLTQQDVIWLCDRYGVSIDIRSKLNRYSLKVRRQYIKRKYGKQSEMDSRTAGEGSGEDGGEGITGKTQAEGIS